MTSLFGLFDSLLANVWGKENNVETLSEATAKLAKLLFLFYVLN